MKLISLFWLGLLIWSSAFATTPVVKTIDSFHATGGSAISTPSSAVWPITNGGSGASTQQTAIDALTGTQSSGQYLRSNGTHASLSAIQAGDVPTLNQNTTGTSASFTGNLTGAVTSSGMTTTFVDQFTGHIVSPGNYTYVIDQSAAFDYTINSIIIQTSSGTDTVALKIGATSVTGCSAVSVSSTPATRTCTAANSVSVGNRITLVVSSDSSAVDLSFTIKVTR